MHSHVHSYRIENFQNICEYKVHSFIVIFLVVFPNEYLLNYSCFRYNPLMSATPPAPLSTVSIVRYLEWGYLVDLFRYVARNCNIACMQCYTTVVRKKHSVFWYISRQLYMESNCIIIYNFIYRERKKLIPFVEKKATCLSTLLWTLCCGKERHNCWLGTIKAKQRQHHQQYLIYSLVESSSVPQGNTTLVKRRCYPPKHLHPRRHYY